MNIVEEWINNRSSDHVYDLMDDLVFDDPERALVVINEILQSTDKDRDIQDLAAGPLEDLLVRHGSLIIDRVEELATSEEKFKHLLGGVWQNTMSDDLWSKVLAARGDCRW